LTITRNSHRTELLYVHNSCPLAPAISELAEKAAGLSEKERAEMPGEAIDPALSHGVSGLLLPVAGDTCPAVITGVFGLGDDIISNAVLCAVYKLPPHMQHICKLMEGTVLPEPSIKLEDLPPEKTLWHEDRGGGSL
jgi:5'-3' exoribonuclease 2